MRSLKTKEITTIGILCALAMILNIMISFPFVPAVPFLKYDPKDIIIVIGGFVYGPFAALLMSFVTAILELFIRGGTYIDVIMNVISTASFACLAAYIYKKNHTKKGAIIGLVSGVLLMTLLMTIWNYIVTPIYYQMPREAVVDMLLPGIIPFNLIKSGLNAGITMLLYKTVVTVLRRTNLVSQSESDEKKNYSLLWVGLFVTVTIVCIILALKGII